ncbi:MAG TPA: hypothetical protein VJT32_08040 [bacterium]|nr:hypothetical protein [bacterium]
MITQLIADTIAQFPAEFGLRAFPGERFRISRMSSYASDWPVPGTIYLYTQRRVGDRWLDFAKATPAELRTQVVAL